MLSERMLSTAVSVLGKKYFRLEPDKNLTELPDPEPGLKYMLYMHVPFCEVMCPYCSFNRFPFSADRAKTYFHALREEMRMLADKGYTFHEVYVGGGTPTVEMDELARTIDLARELFPTIGDVSSETNPNHLAPEYLKELSNLVQRLSVGVQSFDNGLLKRMARYNKYGSAETILERIQAVADAHIFKSLNVDMIFNYPSQTADMIRHDIACVKASGANQTTFYPLMVSPASRASIEKSVGHVDYRHEEEFYHLIYDSFCGGQNPEFRPSSCYTFSREQGQMIDEYVVNYEQYPAIGSGGISYLGGSLYINTFSLRDYAARIAAGKMSVMARTDFPKRDVMRYRFMMGLFGLSIDKRAWRERFGCSVQAGLPVEYAFMKANGAFDRDDDEMLTLTRRGRYLMVVMMRQFFIGVNSVRDQARAALPGDEHKLVFDGIEAGRHDCCPLEGDVAPRMTGGR